MLVLVPDMPTPFVIDGGCHPFNLAPENQRGALGKQFTDLLWHFHTLANPPFLPSIVNPPATALSREQWERNWQPEEFAETMLLESDTEMLCVHSTPIFHAYEDGLVSVEKCARLKRAYPDRVIWYGTIDVWQGERALESMAEQVEMGAEGFNLYPADHYRGRTRFWRMDNWTMAFPVFETALDLGIHNIAVHKALPAGPVPPEAMAVDDVAGAAAAFPDINFQIVNAGFMFLEQTKMLLLGHPNVYANLEATFLFCMRAPITFMTVLAEFIAYGGPQKLIYASAGLNPHPRYLLDAFAQWQMFEGYPVPLTDEIRAAILGGNLAGLHNIDIEERRTRLASDDFAERKRDGLREPWSGVLAQLNGS